MPPGIEQHDQEAVIKKTEETAERIAKQRGHATGQEEWVITQSRKPVIDPRKAFMSKISKACKKIPGVGSKNYSRPSRRSRGGVVLPRRRGLKAKILIIVDTSGSMSADEHQLSFGLITKVIDSLDCREGVRVVTGDSKSITDTIMLPKDRKLNLVGGGGTNMGLLVEDAARKHKKLDLILVCTDGYTPWPANPVGPPVIACLTDTPSDCYQVPTWMDKVSLAVV